MSRKNVTLNMHPQSKIRRVNSNGYSCGDISDTYADQNHDQTYVICLTLLVCLLYMFHLDLNYDFEIFHKKNQQIWQNMPQNASLPWNITKTRKRFRRPPFRSEQRYVREEK